MPSRIRIAFLSLFLISRKKQPVQCHTSGKLMHESLESDFATLIWRMGIKLHSLHSFGDDYQLLLENPSKSFLISDGNLGENYGFNGDSSFSMNNLLFLGDCFRFTFALNEKKNGNNFMTESRPTVASYEISLWTFKLFNFLLPVIHFNITNSDVSTIEIGARFCICLSL